MCIYSLFCPTPGPSWGYFKSQFPTGFTFYFPQNGFGGVGRTSSLARTFLVQFCQASTSSCKPSGLVLRSACVMVLRLCYGVTDRLCYGVTDPALVLWCYGAESSRARQRTTPPAPAIGAWFRVLLSQRPPHHHVQQGHTRVDPACEAESGEEDLLGTRLHPANPAVSTVTPRNRFPP